MVTSTQSGFSGVPGVELLNGDTGIVEGFCYATGLHVFWIISSPLGLVLKFGSVEARVKDFGKVILGFSLYLDRRWRGLDLSKIHIVLVWL